MTLVSRADAQPIPARGGPAESRRRADEATYDLAPPLRVGWAGCLLVAALTVTALNSRGTLANIVTPNLKLATVALALLGVAVLVIRERARVAVSPRVVLVLLFAGCVTLASIVQPIPAQRLLLLGQFLCLTAGLLVFDARRPGRAIGVLYWTGVAHMVIAVTFATDTTWDNGRARLSGGSHPITLGFEASMVLLYSLALALTSQRGRGQRVLAAVVCMFAVYIDLRAFSRESLVGAAVALAVLAVAWPGSYKPLRLAVIVFAGGAVLLTLGADGVTAALGADHFEDLTSVTGRTDIWAKLLAPGQPFPTLGYGFAALNDGIGPDFRLYAATNHEEAENALLQVLLDSGLIGLVLWSASVVLAVITILRARSPFRAPALAFLVMLLVAIAVSSSPSGEGLQWYWLLAVAAAAARSRTSPDDQTGRQDPRKKLGARGPAARPRAISLVAARTPGRALSTRAADARAVPPRPR